LKKFKIKERKMGHKEGDNASAENIDIKNNTEKQM